MLLDCIILPVIGFAIFKIFKAEKHPRRHRVIKSSKPGQIYDDTGTSEKKVIRITKGSKATIKPETEEKQETEETKPENSTE